MKIGDYVRTDKGLIGKVIKKEEYDTHTILEYKGQYCKRVLSTTGTDSEIIKSSPNIIDLIEVGDYVNGHYVEGVEKVPNEEVYKVIITSTCDGMDGETLNIYKEEIESIVTKEQFSSMEYKIGDE